MKENEFSTVELDGFKMELDSEEYIDRTILKTRIFEPVTTRWVRETVKSGSTVIDIGANIGFFTMLAASLTGPNGRVVAVEPTAYAMHRLQRNCAVNGFHHVQMFKCALGRETRYAVDITFDPKEYLSGSDTSMRSSWRTMEGGIGSSHAGLRDFCDFIPLDLFCAREMLDFIDLIKIDVDGHELTVLEGARNTIASLRPTLILEILDASRGKQRFDDADMNRNMTEIVEFLFTTGYCATAETGESFADPRSLLEYIRNFKGASGAPNFLFKCGN